MLFRSDQKGWNGSKADSVVKIVEEMMEKLPIDPKRIYLTGYSMGGYGTFHLLAQEPKLWAAAIPVAGGGNSGAVKRSEEHTSELQSRRNLVCRLLLEKKKLTKTNPN